MVAKENMWLLWKWGFVAMTAIVVLEWHISHPHCLCITLQVISTFLVLIFLLITLLIIKKNVLSNNYFTYSAYVFLNVL